jgi:3-isopropylmalate dehydratase small subunit
MGKAYKYGDNVDTDVIIPARYLNISDPAELAKHAMEDIDIDFAASAKPGDVIVPETILVRVPRANTRRWF